MNAKQRLIVALDFANAGDAASLVERLGGSAGFYKIGLELLFGGGLDLASKLKAGGNHIFLDMKLLDIGNTVEKATANIASRGLDFLTVHGHDRKTLDAAVKGRGANGLKLLAVTVLTSLDQADLAEQGLTASPREMVVRRARMAADAGFDGCIASGEEAAAIRAVVPKSFLIVTPGIRPAGSAAGDQARVTTPAKALGDGATHLVVGRPITAAADPKTTTEAILAEMAVALSADGRATSSG
jgi:orotidine-5'-phosphate decarboxylase